MPIVKFTVQLADVTGILDLADTITVHDPALSYLAHRPMASPLLAGAVVLLCARFEEFLKDVVVYALERHGYSQPPLALWDLPEDMQIHLIAESLNAAAQATRHGTRRPAPLRISESLAAAREVVNGVISAEYAIDTGGNPGSETVKALMKIAGVTEPWKKVSDHLSASYVAPTIPGVSTSTIANPANQLDELIKLRNTVAHSGTSIPAPSSEIRFDVDFLRQLSNSIYDVLKTHVDTFCASSGRTPAVWAR